MLNGSSFLLKYSDLENYIDSLEKSITPVSLVKIQVKNFTTTQTSFEAEVITANANPYHLPTALQIGQTPVPFVNQSFWAMTTTTTPQAADVQMTAKLNAFRYPLGTWAICEICGYYGEGFNSDPSGIPEYWHGEFNQYLGSATLNSYLSFYTEVLDAQQVYAQSLTYIGHIVVHDVVVESFNGWVVFYPNTPWGCPIGSTNYCWHNLTFTLTNMITSSNL